MHKSLVGPKFYYSYLLQWEHKILNENRTIKSLIAFVFNVLMISSFSMVEEVLIRLTLLVFHFVLKCVSCEFTKVILKTKSDIKC